MQESVRVVVRCRPFSRRELDQQESAVCRVNEQDSSVTILQSNASPTRSNGAETTTAIGEDRRFTFDTVFDEQSTQRQLYDSCARPIVEAALQGYNGTIFAYGQTGTGKTFTMQGVSEDPQLRGIIPATFQHIFDHIRDTPHMKFLVSISYLEIYNEDIRDLLADAAGQHANTKSGLEVKEHPEHGVYVKDLSCKTVTSAQEMEQWMTVGNRHRSVGATLMNEQSSRSHSIFSITVESGPADPEANPGSHVVAGKLHLVDLAGSERQSKTGAQGQRLKEAAKINLSLSALGNCISALVDGKSSHVPYRDSKLTRLLQDALGGNAKTLMIATISPAQFNLEETTSTLRYANRTKSIKNKPKVNADPKDAMLMQYQEEIARLRALLGQNRQPLSAAKSTSAGGGLGSRPRTGAQSTSSNESLEAQWQAKTRALEEERRIIMEKTSLAADEKKRALESLAQRQQESEREHRDREALATKLKQLESSLIEGGQDLSTRIVETEQTIQLRMQALVQNAEREQDLHRRLQKNQEEQSQLEGTYTSLQEEVLIKTKKLKKLMAKVEQLRCEIDDLKQDFSQEKDDYMDSIRALTRQLALKDQILDTFVPAAYRQRFMDMATWDGGQEAWSIQTSPDKDHLKRGWPRRDTMLEPVGLERPATLWTRWNLATRAEGISHRFERLIDVPMYTVDSKPSALSLFLMWTGHDVI